MPGNFYVYPLVAPIKMLMSFLLAVEIICISYLLPNQTNVFTGDFEVLRKKFTQRLCFLNFSKSIRTKSLLIQI